MNIDSALRMIDNEISNFGGQIKMQAGLMLPGTRRGDSTTRGGRWGGGTSWWPKIAVMTGDFSRMLIMTAQTVGGLGRARSCCHSNKPKRE